MASGRPDYWSGVLPGHSVSSDNQTDWVLAGAFNILAGDIEILASYVVPDGYTLYVMGGNVSCDSPGVNRAVITLSNDRSFTVAFDTCYNLLSMSSGSIIINTGETFKVTIYSLDIRDAYFWCGFIGFLRKV